MELKRGARRDFDERQFEARLWQLRRRVMWMSRAPRPDYRYTAFVLRVLWVVVVVPFLTGVVCAFVLSR